MNDPAKITLGWHWLIDLSSCGFVPTQVSELEAILCDAAQFAGATIVQRCFHEFSPHGLTGILVIAESHMAVHTWPEHRGICIDMFSCSEDLNVMAAIEYFKRSFQAADCSIRQHLRQASSKVN